MYWYGGDLVSYVVSVGTGNTAVFEPGVILFAWNAREGGQRYEDLLDANGAPLTYVTVSDGTDGYQLGALPRFQAPEPTIYLGQDGQPRVLAITTDLPEMIAVVSEAATNVRVALSAHAAQQTGHGTGMGDLADVEVGTPVTRAAGEVIGWDGGRFTMLTPAQMTGAVLLNPPPAAGGSYAGNIAQPPDPNGTKPWLQMRQPYSASDTNPDGIQLFSTASDSTTPIKTNWANGNNEGRDAPSTRTRVARRVFEAYEQFGGPSTGRFFELSTNPASSANREALFGAYGTGHPSMPGWMVATRVLAGQAGVRAGGAYNGLASVNFRGLSSTPGPPTTGAWATADVVIDPVGSVHLCTAGGTPGTWTTAAGTAAPTAYVDLTPGVNTAQGSKHAATRLERGGDTVRLRGSLTATAPTAAGEVLATISTTAHRPRSATVTIARYTGGGTKLAIATNGDITAGNAMTTGQEIWLDSITWDLTP